MSAWDWAKGHLLYDAIVVGGTIGVIVLVASLAIIVDSWERRRRRRTLRRRP